MIKKLGTAYRIKEIPRYGAQVAVFQLTKQFKKAKCLVVSLPKVVSGRPDITMWASNEVGAVTDNTPVHISKGKTIKDAFLEIGYQI